MRQVRPSLRESLLAVACALWVAAFLSLDPNLGAAAPLVVTPLVSLAVLLSERRPIGAGLAVALTVLVAIRLGVPTENEFSLLPTLLISYAAGCYLRRRHGVLIVPVQLLATTAQAEFLIVDLVFGLLIFGAAWAFGRMVRRRTEDARRANADHAALTATDPGLVSADVARAERDRLSRETVAVIRSAVRDMEQSATQAEDTLDARTIQGISNRGQAAVSQLRRLLGLLREEPVHSPMPPPAPGPVAARVWRGDVLTAVVVAGLGVMDVLVVPDTSREPLSIGLSAVLYAALMLRRTSPMTACLVAAVPLGVGLLAQSETSQRYAELVTLALLAWTAAGAADRRSWLALALLSGLKVAATVAEEPGNVPFVLALQAVPAFAGYVWHERDRELRRATDQAAVLRRHIDEAVEGAVRAERLRVARELHDVTSHAVGVMVLQAAAAQSLASRSPEGARGALAAVRSAAGQATAELAVLHGVLDPEKSQQPAVGPGPQTRLRDALEKLAAGIDATGSPVSLRLDALPDHPDAAAVVYRVVQESLTNAARHAPGAPVHVTSVRSVRGIELDITNPAGRFRGTPRGGGFGLVGLTERVRALGGELSAGTQPGGGFKLAASIPDGPQVAPATPATPESGVPS